MTNVLPPIKHAIKKTPLWSLLRPRQFHAYGVGAPKTGTVSLARLLGEYRARPEPHTEEIVALLRSSETEAEMCKRLHERDQRWRLECEVGYYLIYVCGVLANEFPEAKFICTVRAPRPWLRSIIDQCINNTRSELPNGYRWLRDYSFGPVPDQYPTKEKPLARYGVHRLTGYLSYWAFHYRTALDILPAERCLFILTKDLSRTPERIANFVGVPVSSLKVEDSHAHKTSEKHGLLEEIGNDYVQKKIDEHCRDVADRLAQEMNITLRI